MAGPFTNAAGENYVRDIVWNGYDANLEPEVVAALNAAQKLVDFPLVLTSGYRSPERNAKAGGAKRSQHLTGNAVDISLKGLSDQQRTQLTRAFVQVGAPRLGVYGGNTAMHVDMLKQSVPEKYASKKWPVYPMYDRSVHNMDRAPKWFTAGLDGGLIPPAGMPSDPPIPAVMTAGLRPASLPAEASAYANGQPPASPQGDLVQLLEQRAKKFDPVESGAKPADLLTMLRKRAEKPTQAQMQDMRAVPSQLKLDEVSALVDRIREAEPNGSPLTIKASPEQLTAANETLRSGLAPKPSFDRNAVLNPSTFPARPAVIPSNGPATRNPIPSVPNRTAAPGSGLTRAQQDAMRAVPASQSTFPARPGVVASNDARPAASGLTTRPVTTVPVDPRTGMPTRVAASSGGSLGAGAGINLGGSATIWPPPLPGPDGYINPNKDQTRLTTPIPSLLPSSRSPVPRPAEERPRPATIAPNIVPGMVSPSPRPHYEIATARANQAPTSIPKTAAERMWETTHFGDPYTMPGVGMPKFADIATAMAPAPPLPRPRPAPVPAQMSPAIAAGRIPQAPIPATMSANLRAPVTAPVRTAVAPSPSRTVAPVMAPRPATMSASLAASRSQPTAVASRTATVAPARTSSSQPVIARATNGYLYEQTATGWQRVGSSPSRSSSRTSSNDYSAPQSLTG